MAIYNASLLISASNATYFTNVTGGIAAVAVRSLNDSWISSSALLTGSQTFVGTQTIKSSGGTPLIVDHSDASPTQNTLIAILKSGSAAWSIGNQGTDDSFIVYNPDTFQIPFSVRQDNSVNIEGSLTASLQTGYVWIGNGSGKTQAVATSSIVTNIATGSFATTGSNTFFGSQIIYGVANLISGAINSLRGNSFSVEDNDGASKFFVNNTSQLVRSLYPLEVQNTFTASLQQGYVWVGGSGSISNAVATSSIITNIATGSFATTGSNTFTGQQSFITTTSPAITISGSGGFGYGIELTGGSGLKITGPGGPRLQFPNEMWLNGNETDNFQFTGDTDNPKSRGLDFFLYGTGSRQMQFRNNSGNGATMTFQTTTGTGGNSIQFQSVSGGIQLNAGSGINITGSNVQMQGFTYPTTDGTNGQVLTTNGSKTLSFTTVSINTGSFATTGSNVFFGSQTFNVGVSDEFRVNWGSASSASMYTENSAGPNQTLNLNSASLYLNRGGLFFPSGSFTSQVGDMQFNAFPSASFTIRTQYGGDAVLRANTDYTDINRPYAYFQASPNGQINIIGRGDAVIISGSVGTSIQGFTYPNTDGTAGQVLTTNGSKVLTFTSITASATTNTGSLLVTASFDNTTRDITFTKGDNTTFKLGGFATTGSNTFTGNQTISGSSGGGNFNINAAGTANGQIQINQTGAGNLQFLQSGSIIIRTTNIGSIDHNWTSSFYNDINVANGRITLTGHPTPTTAASYLLGWSGSLVLGNSVSTTTYTGLSNITSSQQNSNTNLMFKSGTNNTGSTYVNGQGNIFTVPTAPANLTYQKYIGGNNNLYLQNQGGVQTLLTSSAASVSGNRPTMHNNIIYGQSDFTINLPNNPGSNNYNQNLINGTTTINAMAFTGSLTLSNNINNNGTIQINAASASFAEIASGLSGSHTINVQGNGIFGGQIIFTTNRNQPSNISHTLSNNLLAGGGALQIINPSSSVAIQVSNNITNGTITYNNTGAAGLALHRNTSFVNTNYGPLNLIASASAINAQSNICSTALTVTNRMYSGSLGSGSVGFNNNSVQGALNTYTVSGSYNGTAAGTLFAQNAVYGARNTFFTNVEGRGNYVNFSANGIFGNSLILTGSNNTILIEEGGAHIGRYNADDGRRNTTGENIFSVGTGTSTARKTGFLIDSGSNTFIEGTLNVSGSTTMTGSLILSSSAATELFVIGNTEMTGSLAVSSFTTLASVSSSLNFADDTAAAAGGVPLGGLYRNGNFVMIRLT
jgi:hypothetical protein